MGTRKQNRSSLHASLARSAQLLAKKIESGAIVLPHIEVDDADIDTILEKLASAIPDYESSPRGPRRKRGRNTASQLLG